MRKLIALLFAGLLFLAPAVPLAQQMEYIGSTLWSDPEDIVVKDSLAYCSFQAGLIILNCREVSDPVYVSKLYFSGEGKQLALSGDYIYFADRYCGLEIVDISDPITPMLVGEFSDHTIEDVFIDGAYAYIIDYSSFRIIDVSDQSQPSLVGECQVGSDDCSSVWVDGNYAYITALGFGSALSIFDISDRTNPTIISSYGIYTPAYDVCVRNNYAYVACIPGGNDADLLILDVSDPSSPTLAGQYRSSGSAQDIFFSGNKAFIGYLAGGGFEIANIADPVNPQFWYRYTNAINGKGLFVEGDYMYFAESPIGIQIVNVLDYPFDVGNYSTHYWSQGIAVRDNYAFIASGSAGLRTVNIADPYNPLPVGQYVTSWLATSVFLNSNYAYIIIGDQGVQIVNVSDPSVPRGAGRYVTRGTARDIYVEGNYAYIVDGELRIVNISNPARPVLVDTLHTPGYAYGITVSGNYAYVADGYDGGLIKVDITNPTNPVLVAGYDTPGRGADIAIAGDYAYLADDTSGLQIFNISDPDTLALVGHLRGHIELIYISGGYIYLSPSGYGIRVYDISNPTNLTEVANYLYVGTGGFCADDNYVYVSRAFSQIILRMNPTSIEEDTNLPNAFNLAQNYPNPFNAQTTISFSLAKAGQVKLEIYNIMGQKVTTLLNGMGKAGEQNVIWDAKDYASGVYFARLHTAESTNNIAMLLMK